MGWGIEMDVLCDSCDSPVRLRPMQAPNATGVKTDNLPKSCKEGTRKG